jgi:hypothetical protein
MQGIFHFISTVDMCHLIVVVQFVVTMQNAVCTAYSVNIQDFIGSRDIDINASLILSKRPDQKHFSRLANNHSSAMEMAELESIKVPLEWPFGTVCA